MVSVCTDIFYPAVHTVHMFVYDDGVDHLFVTVVLPVDSSTPSVHTPLVAEIGRLQDEVGTLPSS